VFTRSGSTWTQQGPKLTGTRAGAPNGNGAAFGSSVALSADGNTALIGGPSDHGGAGAAWVFTRSGSTWTQQGPKLTGAPANFGDCVALSADGNTALIGGPEDGNDGAAWVFTRSGSTWTQQGSKLTGTRVPVNALFGSSVALSADGNTALIGGPYGYEGNHDVGVVWVFTRSGSTWTQQGSKRESARASEDGGSLFGFGVALSADGNTALIGGPDDGNGGAAWVFTRSRSTWTQQRSKLTSTGATVFGESVALSADGNTALIGGDGDNDAVGAAWVFTQVAHPARVMITAMHPSPLRHGCAVETGRDERELTAVIADATCRHLRLTVHGLIHTHGKRNPSAAGTITLTYRVRLPRGPATGTARGAVKHGRWRVSLVLPAVNLDPRPPSYLITVYYNGDHNQQAGITSRRIRLESERAALHP
jgi:hypothetical protein